ncbi:MAG: family 78 glycoside hydrolase catalytic domain, partial [Clostridia bacterium]|nr:family 78 glycoside hydrolase catalytic domain [Clostridia bacterium]
LTADDYFKLWLNGEFVGQGPAAGYHFAYYYNEFDLSPFAKAGENEIFLDVYYQGVINRVWNSGDLRQGLVADLFCGEEYLCSADESWLYTHDTRYTSRETFGYETQFVEDFDERMQLPAWQPLQVKENTDYTFEKCTTPVEVTTVYPPVCRTEENVTFCDFVQEVMGTFALKAEGPAGARVIIRCGEELLPDGHVRYDMRCNCHYEDVWTLAGGESCLQQYDYKAFRYAEIICEDGAELLDVAARVRHYPFPDEACTLVSDNENLNAVFELCKNTMKFCTQEGFMDCPSREKGQYAGDLTITGGTHMLLTGKGDLFLKAIENQIQSLQIVPGMLAVTPGSFMQEIADYSLQFPLLVERYYNYTGDEEFLRRGIAACDAVIEHFNTFARPDGLLDGVTDKWNLVDWPYNLRDGYDFEITKPVGPGCHNVLNAFWVGCVAVTEDLKRRAGMEFTSRAESLKAAFNAAFLKENGIYTDTEASTHSAVHSNILPAFAGIVPEENKAAVAAFLKEKGIRGGVYMAFFHLKALARLGEYEEIFNLITEERENSWMNMIKEGATTLYEAWGRDKKDNCSLCHPWAAAPVLALAEDLLGMQYDPKTKTAVFAPRLPEDVGYLSFTVTINGQWYTCNYNKDNRLLTRQIHVRDPFVLPVDGKYYMYGTRGGTCWGKATGFDVYESTDLEHWTGPKAIFTKTEDFWSDMNYWAPEVHAFGGKYYLFASFKSEDECRGTQILVCDTPNGTFVPLSDRPVTPRDWECLDGTLYVSPEGKPWIVFCHEWVQVKDGEICAMPLTDDLSAAAGAPIELFKASQAAGWIRPVNDKGDYVTDGPFMHRCEDGTLRMIWSSFGELGYTQAVAKSESGDITGPWVHEEDLLMEKDGGHGMIFRDLSGDLRLVLHSPNKTPLERPKFFYIKEENGKLLRNE